jgi:FKBP-type peptidyl-prolyl cis-trans isomerase FklB
MKKLITVAIMLSLFVGTAKTQKNETLKTTKDKVSYSIGVNIAKNMKMQGLDIDQGMLVQGIKDELSGSKIAMSEIGRAHV